MQKLQQNYQSALQDREKKAKDELEAEVLSRCSYLASITIELQRCMSEIESKTAFLRNQFNNADHATHISMTNVFNNYMKQDVFQNIDMLVNINFEGISTNLYKIEKREQSEYRNVNK
jgi:hypothetical protein